MCDPFGVGSGALFFFSTNMRPLQGRADSVDYSEQKKHHDS
jgi:hypothetical protein